MKTKLTIIALASAFTFVLVAQQQRSSPVRPPGTVELDARIVSKLSEIVSIRERIAKSYEQMLAAGRVPSDGLPLVELAEARVDLARERGQSDAIVTELHGLVAVHEQRVKRLTSRGIDQGVSSDDIDRAQAALLGAQVLLMRAQK